MSTKCVINVDLVDIWGEAGRKKFLRTLAWGDEIAVTEQDSARIAIETVYFNEHADGSILPVKEVGFIEPKRSSGLKTTDLIRPRSQNDVLSKELTTSVLWLIDHGIDICCIRMRPYKDGERTLVDVQQIIPLPEAHEYQVQLREKGKEERKQRAERYDLRKKYWEDVVALSKETLGRHANIKPGSYHWIGAGSGIGGLGLNLVVTQQAANADLYIDRGEHDENKSIFDQLYANRAQIEAAVPFVLEWERLDNRRACRIKTVIPDAGYRTPEEKWPQAQRELVVRIAALEKALRPLLDKLQL